MISKPRREQIDEERAVDGDVVDDEQALARARCSR